jgi:hypothetical protein
LQRQECPAAPTPELPIQIKPAKAGAIEIAKAVQARVDAPKLELAKSAAKIELTTGGSQRVEAAETAGASSGNRLITEQDVEDAHKAGLGAIECSGRSVITPLARDAARKYGILLPDGGSL